MWCNEWLAHGTVKLTLLAPTDTELIGSLLPLPSAVRTLSFYFEEMYRPIVYHERENDGGSLNALDKPHDD